MPCIRAPVPPTTETHDLLRPIIARTSDASVTRLPDPSHPPLRRKRSERARGQWVKALVDEVRREREAGVAGGTEVVERIHGREAVRALVHASRPGEAPPRRLSSLERRVRRADLPCVRLGRFEIVKRHHEIAVLSLPRTAWRTGEAVHGLVRFHRPGARFDVLKVSPSMGSLNDAV